MTVSGREVITAASASAEQRSAAHSALDVVSRQASQTGLTAARGASPIDLVPDFVPVLGYADDAIIVVLTLRSVARAAGPEALRRHWTGSPDGLRALRRLAKV